MSQRLFLEVILSPAPAEKCSVLLKRTGAPIAYIQDQKSILEFQLNEKAPEEDEPQQGLSRGDNESIHPTE